MSAAYTGYGEDVPPLLVEPDSWSPVHGNGNDSRQAKADDERTTWEPIDLGPWLRGDIAPPQPPSVGARRSDGIQLIYPGREHALVGETESGKTWLALACVAAELIDSHRVVYVHYEEGSPESTIERLRLLGVPDDLLLPPQFRFVAPQQAAHKEWIKALLDPTPTLVVHDGVNEAMSLHGAEIEKADGAATFRRRLITPFLRIGAATIACDHLPMTRNSSRRDAYGSVHKGNALDGARIALENRSPFGRGLRGVSHVYVTKDRPGHLRAQGKPDKLPGKTYIGTLIGDGSDPFSPFSLMFYPPKPDDQPTTAKSEADEIAETVWQVITALPDRTAGSLRALYAQMRKAGHQFTEEKAHDAVDDLIADGRLREVPGKRGAQGFQAVTTAAEADSE
jgi:hypothetical protein